jgi:hypothetical protein
MNPRLVLVRLAITATLLAVVHAQAQNAAPPTGSGLPDACKLMLQSDLEALFPGMPVSSKGPTLSPIYQGPQYNEICTYDVRLPSPIARTDNTNLISLHVISCDACDVRNHTKVSATQVIDSFRDSEENMAANPSRHMQVEQLSDVGDQAFRVTRSDVKVYARKDDLVFSVLILPKYSDQTEPNAVALARQVAKRWRGGVGMVEAATPIAANTSVELPPDTREVTTASADKWPDACALLAPADVGAVFGDMTIGQQQRTMGKITYSSRIDRVEALPYPIRCSYEAHKVTTVNGKHQVILNTIDVFVDNVATSVDVAKRNYQIVMKSGSADTPVPGLGDEASIDIMNHIYVRKGVVTIAVHVGGDARDQALHADARRRVNEIAKLVAAKLP